MKFTAVSAALVGLLSLSSAVPHSQGKCAAIRDLGHLPARGLTFLPKRAKNNNVQVTDTTFEQITEVQRGNEVELVTLVKQKLSEQSQKINAKDNIRRNHFASKNKNANTILTVVTEVIDARANAQITRIMTHQIIVDNKSQENIEVQVQEIKQIKIVVPKATKASKTAAEASASATVQIPQVAQGAPFLASNATVMLPIGASKPVSNQIETDPAAILEEDQTNLFVAVASD